MSHLKRVEDELTLTLLWFPSLTVRYGADADLPIGEARRKGVIVTIPTAFRWPISSGKEGRASVRSVVKRLCGFDLLPTEDIALSYARLFSTGDPVAERFVDETFHGPLGPQQVSRDAESGVDDFHSRRSRCPGIDDRAF